jgi:hypothetical protein
VTNPRTTLVNNVAAGGDVSAVLKSSLTVDISPEKKIHEMF